MKIVAISHEKTIQSVAECSSQIDPNAWLNKIGDKKIRVQDILQEDKADIIQKSVNEYISSFDRLSLIDKTRVLHSILKPNKNTSNFRYSEDNLRRIDQLRHDSAHGRIGVTDFSKFNEDLVVT